MVQLLISLSFCQNARDTVAYRSRLRHFINVGEPAGALLFAYDAFIHRNDLHIEPVFFLR